MVAFLLVTGSGAAAEPLGQPEQPVGTYVHRPPARVVVRVPVKNLAEPSEERVVQIAKLEQRVWGGPSIVDRMFCESGWAWNASNGAHFGVLQFAPATWASMWPGTPRQIRWPSMRRRQAPVVEWTLWPDGNRTREVIGRVRQKVRIIRRATLPKDATYWNATAAIRVGQRAVSGSGPSTYWVCGL